MLAPCAGLGLSFPDINEWGKKKRPVPTASTAGIYMSVINIENALVLKVPWHLHLVNCFQEGMLEFDGPMGQCFSRCLTVSHRSRGKGENRKGGTG